MDDVPGIVKPEPVWQRPGFAAGLLFILAFVFNWPYLTGGFYADDFMFLNLFRHDLSPFSRWLGLWSISDYPMFDSIWWKDLDWKVTFLRPIPSGIIESSFKIFGENPFPLHLLSLLLHGGVAAGVYFLARELTGRHALAFLAGIFYVTCEDHSMGVGWIATITDMMCVFFILPALLGHIRWLKRRRWLMLAGSWVALIMALGCKETALVAPLAMVLLTFFMPSGKDEDINRNRLRQRLTAAVRDWLSWAPTLFILIVYMITYKALGMGASANYLYIDPLTQPIRYLSHLAIHLPIMFAGTLSPLPPFVATFIEEIQVPMALAGLILFAFWLMGLAAFRRLAIVWWSIIVYILAILPQLATDASERGLYFPMIPAAILLAYILRTIGPIARRLTDWKPVGSKWTRAFGWASVFIILLPGIVISVWRPFAIMPSFGKPEREVRTAVSYVEKHDPERILVLNTSGFMMTIYIWDILIFHTGELVDEWTLSSGNGVYSLEKTGDSSFIIYADRPGWLSNFFAKLFRVDEPLNPGDQFTTKAFTAEILEVDRDRNDALAVKFDLALPISDPGWLFLRWNGKAFEPLDLASMDIGQKIKLADTSDWLKSMI